MKVDLLGGSYQQKYKDFNSQRTINRYVVPTSGTNKDNSQSASYPTPGLTQFIRPIGRYNRGLFNVTTHDVHRCFQVVDQTLYEILPNKTYLTWGTLTNICYGSSKVHMAVNDNDQLYIGHHSGAYVFNLATNTFAAVTDVLFPGDAGYAVASDGYIFITSAGSVFFSRLNDATTWPGSQTFAPTWKAAKTVAVSSLREQIYNFTKQTIEIFLNDGTSPYSRLPRSTIATGLLAEDSLAVWNDGFLFLGTDVEGEAAVYYFDGWYTCQAVSGFAITWALNNLASQEDLKESYGYIQRTKDGHVWYYLTVPALKTTFVYDFMTKEWQERRSKQPFNDADGSNVFREFRGKHYVNFKGLHLFADQYSGKVFIEDWTNFTEDGNTIRRERVSQRFEQDDQLISVTRLIIECNTGYGIPQQTYLTWDQLLYQTWDQWTTAWGQFTRDPNFRPQPVIMMQVSKDGGYNFSQPRLIKLGLQGNHIYRAKINKLGTSRKWVIKLVDTDQTDLMYYNAVARGEISSY